ncbi:HD-GYP domain-containing protein [Paenibacillus arenilitoris]|uniref:HD domain-containing protein n=1 Tax=Paenibacillus arenilitoris TaxID=2772299 RepID=A0A927CME9_9BACL|nr:HD domain-containing phosphohydrolase [Paenibacillus arenilitoris]MBD2869258.1 HD domain-containing protein [Paenibacillus arenilitoris]
MKYIGLEQVEPGQVLGKSIYSGNGRVLLAAGVPLTVYMVNTLNRIGVTMLYIHDPAFDDVMPEEMVSEVTRREVLQETNDMFEAIRSGKEWSSRTIRTSVGRVLEDVMSSKELLLQLTEIRTKDNAQYVHALNVCVISAVIGMNMSLNYSQLKELAIGALLHDVGKIERAAGGEPESGKREHHTWRGFELLKTKQEFGLMAAHIALQHHERVDGLGEPRGLSAQEIHPYAKIVAAANMYDNLINSLDGEGCRPDEACEKLMAMSEQQLDHEILVQFIRNVSVYPNGSAVRLSTKETGVVVRQHRGLPARPVVRIVQADGDMLLGISELDLAEHPTVFIETVLT